MTTHTQPASKNVLLRKVGNLVKAVPIARKIAAWWLKDHDASILAGTGAGLRFNIAGTTPTYISGNNELPVQTSLGLKLKPGQVFYDIGANIGFFTVIAARLVGQGGQVIAFEPVPGNVRAIKHNAAINHFEQIRVVEVAVSDHSGTGELLLASWKGGAALAATGAPPPDMSGSMDVALVSIDELLEQGKIPPPNCIKIDVEGAEIDVLRGMQKTIAAYHPVILYEIDDHDLAAYADKQTLCEEILKSKGYKVTRLENSYSSNEWLVGHYIAE